ncbi:MAG: 16S rRNA (guanine(527)-N(7))-methyltransferase RsmG [Gammaproteobacteria bacterium]|nr:MAG: 16S rRNA (guanine(527)-N(7))-methyltransferase RsmG [Gammaproteobacteria bacterium]
MERAVAQLEAGLGALGLDPALAAPLADYLALLARWNRTHNLTAIRDPERMVTHHLLDSLAVLPWIPERGRLLDIGSGAGLPGIPLALARPGLEVTLIDSVGKKAAFMQQAVTALGLDNARVVHGRVEDYPEQGAFDTVISRAFSSLAEFTDLSRPLLAPGGRWLAMKGRRPDEELAELPEDVRVLAVHPVAVPGLEAERHLVELAPEEQAPSRNPS